MRRKREDEAARWLAAEVARLGGEMCVAASTLIALFEADVPDTAWCARVTQALQARDISVSPALSPGIKPQNQVTLSDSRPREPRQPPTRLKRETSSAPISSVPSPAEVVASQVAAAPAAALAAGALIPGIWLGLVGFAFWWVAGLVVFVAASGVWLLARRARFWLGRIFWFPSRSLWLSAFVMLALPTVLVAAVVGAAISPAVISHKADERRDAARVQLASAKRALDAGDLDAARREVDAAREEDQHVVESSGISERIVAEQQRRSAAAREQRARQQRSQANADQYALAKDAMERDDYERVLLALGDLDAGYRDTALLRTQATRGLARQQLAQSRAAYARGDFQTARERAGASYSTRPTKAAAAARREASSALARKRARAQARARTDAQARAERRRAQRAQRRQEAERRRQEAERRRQEQELQRQQDATPAAPSIPDTGGGGGCANGSPIPDYPGQRDADHDGCYGEK